MKKLFTICAVMLMLIAGNANVFAAFEDVLLPLGASDVTNISFDYTYGGNPNAPNTYNIELQIKGYYDGSGHYAIEANFVDAAGTLVIDTAYGPYKASGTYLGENSYNFMLNSRTGLWTLAINGNPIDFYAVAAGDISGYGATENPQPDSTSFTLGPGLIRPVVANKYYSDGSTQSGLNALALGWATAINPSYDPEGDSSHPLIGNAKDGVGGAEQFKLRFYYDENSPNSHGPISTPEPATMLLLGLGLMGVAGIRRKFKG